MADLSIASAYTPHVVDLWGTEFETVDATRSVIKRMTAIQGEISKQEAMSEITTEEDEVGEILDGLVDLLARCLDTVLKPIGAARKLPSAIVKAKWEAEEVTIGQLSSFVKAIGELRGDGSGKADRT